MNTLTYTTFPEKHLVNQWLSFQVSGQGPYFGQGISLPLAESVAFPPPASLLFSLVTKQKLIPSPAMFFTLAHTAILPTVQRRYRAEIRRVIGVLDVALEGKQYLVGDKVTIADLAFVPWHVIAPVCLPSPFLITFFFLCF